MDWNDTILTIFLICAIIFVGLCAVVVRYLNKIVKWLLSPINTRLNRK